MRSARLRDIGDQQGTSPLTTKGRTMSDTITPEQLVEREVHACVSALVSTLANAAHGSNDDHTELADLCEQASELSTVLDYEEAARNARWKQSRLEYRDGKLITAGPRWWYRGRRPVLGDIDISIPEARTAQEACEMDNIEPYERKVSEHWVVSEWLADKLLEKGEKVDKNFQGLCIWARTTTGQAIASDLVIEQITADLNRSDEQ